MSSIPSSRLPRRNGPPAPPNWVELESKYKQDIESLTESTEMATIEKEIAEEKLDSCEKELKEIKDRLAEALARIESFGAGDNHDRAVNISVGQKLVDPTVTVLQLQKVEEQNELLKQALIRLRDISTMDKQALEELQLEHDSLQLKALDLEEKEQKYLEQIKIYEEQIDVSQSAQEMVEKLTQQKSELEDKLKEMIDDMDCMEKLRDLNEQLLETARENEIELTGELDQMRMQLGEMNSKRRDLEDYLLDKERDLSKLREENRELQDRINNLMDQFKEGQSIEQQKHQIENVAYKLNFSESKMAEKETELNRYKRNLSEMEEQMNNLSIITKEQSSQIDELKMQLDAKISENSELQRALKKRMEEVSELEIRREMAEKKVVSLQRDMDTKMTNLNRTIETMKGIEVQHEEEIKRLMEDNELIERERRDLRDQLNKSNRSLERSMQSGTNISCSMVTAQDISLASLGITYPTSNSNQASPIHQSHHQQQHHHIQQTVQSQNSQSSSLGQNSRARDGSLSSMVIDESPYMSKVKGLSAAFDMVNRRNHRLEMELAINELKNRIPPYKQQQSCLISNQTSPCDLHQVRSLQREALKLKRELRSQVINQQICTKPSQVNSQTRNDQFQRARLALRYQILEDEVRNLLSGSRELSSYLPKIHAPPMSHSTPIKLNS